MILDLIVVGAVVLAFIISAKRGLVKSVWKIAALIITIVLVSALKTPTVEYLAKTNFADVIYDTVSQKLAVNESTFALKDTETTKASPEPEDKAVEKTNEQKAVIPAYILTEITKSADTGEMYRIINRGTDIFAQKLTLWALRIIVVVGLFIIIRVLLMFAFMIVDAISKLPVIGHANAFLGGLLGAINILAIIYIACALVSLFAARSEVARLINQSYIVKYIYNYNILLQLIFKN